MLVRQFRRTFDLETHMVANSVLADPLRLSRRIRFSSVVSRRTGTVAYVRPLVIKLRKIRICDNVYKFWETWRMGDVVYVRWGRIDTRGQEKRYQFGDGIDATDFMVRKIQSKLRRGYIG